MVGGGSSSENFSNWSNVGDTSQCNRHRQVICDDDMYVVFSVSYLHCVPLKCLRYWHISSG